MLVHARAPIPINLWVLSRLTNRTSFERNDPPLISSEGNAKWKLQTGLSRPTAYSIIGRVDGAQGKEGVLNLPETVSLSVCKQLGWHRINTKPVQLLRLGGLEVRVDGAWTGGGSREKLYKLLNLEPWREGNSFQEQQEMETQSQAESDAAFRGEE